VEEVVEVSELGLSTEMNEEGLQQGRIRMNTVRDYFVSAICIFVFLRFI